jgi:hypothetical protein
VAGMSLHLGQEVMHDWDFFSYELDFTSWKCENVLGALSLLRTQHRHIKVLSGTSPSESTVGKRVEVEHTYMSESLS